MPSLVPSVEDRLIYFVLCDYGPELGQAWAETDPAKADRETILSWLTHGEFTNPIEVLEVNKAAGICRDVTAEFMAKVEERTAAFQ